jgi:hypothetical protein
LTVADVTGGASNIQEWQNASGTLLSRISASGQFVSDQQTYIGSGATGISNARFNVATGSASVIGQVVKGAASQSANLQEWQASDASVKAYVNATGQAFFQNLGTNTRSYMSDISDVTATRMSLNFNSASYGLQMVNVQAAAPALIVKGAASQSASLQEWQNSAGTVLANVDAFGGIRTNSYLQVQSGASTTIPQWIRGAASHVVDLLQYQTNGGAAVLGGRNANAQIYTGSTTPLTTAVGGATTATSGTGTTATLTTTSNHNLAVGDRITVAGVTPTGYNGTFIVTAAATNSVSYANATTGSQTVAGTVSVDAQASITTRSAATSGLIIRMSASQASNGFQVQNSSGSTLAGIDGGGAIYTTVAMKTPNIQGSGDGLTAVTFSTGRNVQLAGNTASSGGGAGVVGISNATTVPTSNPTGGGILYSEGGALKWRGSSGTITTIAVA